MKIQIIFILLIYLLFPETSIAEEKENDTFFCVFKHSYDNDNGKLSDNATPLIIGKKAVIKIVDDKIYLYSNGLYPSPIIFDLLYKSFKPVTPTNILAHKGILIETTRSFTGYLRNIKVLTVNLSNPISFTYLDTDINVIMTGDCIIENFEFK